MRFVPDGYPGVLYLVEAAGRERSHPLGEPEGRAVCVFWLGAPPTIKEDGGRGEIRV